MLILLSSSFSPVDYFLLKFSPVEYLLLKLLSICLASPQASLLSIIFSSNISSGRTSPFKLLPC